MNGTPIWLESLAGNEKRPPVSRKADFVRRYAAGEFGNASPTWDSVEDMEEDFDRSFPLMDNPEQLWHIRNRVAGGPTWYDIDGLDLPDVWEWACKKVGADSLYISAMCPTHLTLFQGEVQQSERYLDLTYTLVAKPMREALRIDSNQANGLRAKLLIGHYLDDNSLAWLNHLLETYPYHVVEFTTLSREWGTVPGYRTIFWEVRNY